MQFTNSASCKNATRMHYLLSDCALTSHTRTVVRGDERKASQWKRPKFGPSPCQNPLTDLHKNWHAWYTSWTAPGMQNFVAIGLRVSAAQIRDFTEPLKWRFLFVFLVRLQPITLNGYLHKIQNTSNDVVPGKEVPFRGLDDYIFYLYP